MLGRAKPRRLDEPIAVSLEVRLPETTYRQLKTKIDLVFVRDWTHELYANRGRPSVALALCGNFVARP